MRGVRGVSREWTSPVDCVKFWSADYKDDSAAKQLPMEKMALKCPKCPKKGLLVPGLTMKIYFLYQDKLRKYIYNTRANYDNIFITQGQTMIIYIIPGQTMIIYL